MILKKMHKYLPYKKNGKKKVYGASIVPMNDVVVSAEVLKNTGFDEIELSDNKTMSEE